jgi:hypothetical protein
LGDSTIDIAWAMSNVKTLKTDSKKCSPGYVVCGISYYRVQAMLNVKSHIIESRLCRPGYVVRENS